MRSAFVRMVNMALSVTGSAHVTPTTHAVVTQCQVSVPASRAGRGCTVMRHVLLVSMGRPVRRSVAARMEPTATV